MLLCTFFETKSTIKPLSLKEYNQLATWLKSVHMQPEDLLKEEDCISKASIEAKIEQERLRNLLSQGVKLGLTIEEWQSNGIWIMSRSDTYYPYYIKEHLKEKSPPLIFGVGNYKLLQGGGLGIVGSRNINKYCEDFTHQVARLCVHNNTTVISGGARGVDQTAMQTALNNGGNVIGILAENLLRKSVEKQNRQAIADNKLLLISPYSPMAPFSIGNAMGRNKLIYALSNYTLVVNSTYKKGGTWTGAEEELKRHNARPIFVEINEHVDQGNLKLQELGAISWPSDITNNTLKETLDKLIKINLLNKNNQISFSAGTNDIMPIKECLSNSEEQTENSEIYEIILPSILKHLKEPIPIEHLAKETNILKMQLKIWLDRMIKDKFIKKLSKPIRYVIMENNITQKNLLDFQ